MKRYPKYTESGVEWIGEVPKEWDVLAIRRLCQVKRGASPRPIDDQKYFDDNGEFAWVRIADVSSSSKYLYRTTQTLSELGSSLSVRKYPDELFLSIAGTVGKPIISKIKCCIHDGFVYFENLSLYHEFLYYIFFSGRPYLGLGKWGTQLNLNTDTIADIKIPVPPYNDQVLIASFLDYKTQQIDNLIDKKKKLIELLKEERTAIINQAVTKGLNKNMPMKDSGIEWLGEIPEHYITKRLGLVCDILDPQPDHRAPQIVENGYPYIGIRDINDDGTVNTESARKISLEAVEKQENSFCINDGDIVFCKVGTLGLPRFIIKPLGRFAISATLVLIKNFKSINTKFLFYILQSYFVENQISISSTGSTRQALGIETIRRFLITYPPLSEQDRIVTYLDRKINNCQVIIAKIQNEIDIMNEYKTSLINEVVTGKIDVRS